MSDPAATGGTPGVAGGGAPGPLTAEAIDAVLRDFRTWLEDLASGGRQAVGAADNRGPDSHRSPEPVDLFTLVGQFTALRHEVNLQTKASRAAVEQNAEVLRQLTANQPPAGVTNDELRPLLKAVLDVADVLALSLRQMERLRESIEPLLADLGGPGEDSEGFTSPGSPRPRPGFFARLFGSAPAPDSGPGEAAKQAAGKLRQLAAAAADGYAMSLRRVERVLPTFGLDPIPCLDRPFDPERMEVIEAVAETDRPPGTVVEEVRAGYTWRGKVFRFAQVKVAR